MARPSFEDVLDEKGRKVGEIEKLPIKKELEEIEFRVRNAARINNQTRLKKGLGVKGVNKALAEIFNSNKIFKNR